MKTNPNKQVNYLNEAELAVDNFYSTNFNPAEHREFLHEMFINYLLHPIYGMELTQQEKSNAHYHYMCIRNLITEIENAPKGAH